MGTFMKIEKLELLLNKVVEFTPPDSTALKGFLQRKDTNQYIIKVIEDEVADYYLSVKKMWNILNKQKSQNLCVLA
jgi:hypothetical protein